MRKPTGTAAPGMNAGAMKPETERGRRILPLSALGTFGLLAGAAVWFETQPPDSPARSPLAILVGTLTLAFLLLLSFWFAARSSKPALAAAVVLRIICAAILLAMAFRVYEDIRNRTANRDTWITAGVLAAGIPGLFGEKILKAFRHRAFYNRANHVAVGRIYRIMGETHLDPDGDPVTLCHALIEYAAEDRVYETRADITRYAIRRFGRDAFIGRPVNVFYDPADPASAFANKIDRHFFDE